MKYHIEKSLKSRLNDLWDYEKISAPFVEGDYTYFYKNTGITKPKCFV